jgi:hypothetical protein
MIEFAGLSIAISIYPTISAVAAFRARLWAGKHSHFSAEEITFSFLENSRSACSGFLSTNNNALPIRATEIASYFAVSLLTLAGSPITHHQNQSHPGDFPRGLLDKALNLTGQVFTGLVVKRFLKFLNL